MQDGSGNSAGGENPDETAEDGEGGGTSPRERRKYKVTDLPIHKDASGAEVIQDLSEVEVASPTDFWAIYKQRI